MSDLAHVFFGKATCYFELGKIDEAIEECTRVINHFEIGNEDNLENEFMAKVYYLRGKCSAEKF